MIDALIEHLTATCPDFAAIEEPSRINPLERDEYPVVTLYPLADRPSELQTFGSLLARRRTWEFRVTAASVDQLETALAALARALTDHRPVGAVIPFAFVEGEVTALDGPKIQWADRWSAVACPPAAPALDPAP